MQGYTIWAFSPSLNIGHRQFDLANMNTPVLNEQQAQTTANYFADSYNRQFKQGVCDWRGQVKMEDMGIHTIPGYIG